MTPMFCSRHQTGWEAPPALCPACHDDRENGGKVAHHAPTPQELADNNATQPDTPRVNYARSCGTSALTIEACKLERELAQMREALESQIKHCGNGTIHVTAATALRRFPSGNSLSDKELT